MARLLCAVLFVGPSASLLDPGNHGYKSSEAWLARNPIITMPTGVELMQERVMPRGFDWRDVNGQNFVTVDINQHQPLYCGSCWIHGTVSALSDRIKIMRKARFPDVVLSRQALVNCVPDPEGVGSPPGCQGGDPWMIHTFMHEHKVPDQTCLSYAAENMECTPLNVCRNCFRMMPPDPLDPFKPGPCWGMPTFIGFGVSDYGQISGEVAMMKEIYARGPIACSGVTTPDFVKNFANNPGVLQDGVFRDAHVYNESEIDHIMEITGWGETAAGQKYWVVRNSWGTYWGVAGWFKLERGTNSLLMEEHCDWAVPESEDLDHSMLNEVQGDYYLGVLGGAANSNWTTPTQTMAEQTLATDTLLKQPGATGASGIVVGAAVAWVLPRLQNRRVAIHHPALLG